MLLWLSTVALAQDRVVWDFDTTFPPTGGAVAYSAWTGSDALRVGVHAGYDVGVAETMATLSHVGDGTFVVTHDGLTLSWDQDYWTWGAWFAFADVSSATTAVQLSGQVGGTFTETGLLPLCGASVELDLWTVGTVSTQDFPDNVGNVWIDDVGFTGDVCPGYLDADGDGWCPDGRDLDGDGTCTADDERGAGVDCDDAQATTYPGAPELACNQVDDDCDPATPDVVDADGDGFDTCSDCNDADGAVFPGAVELACNLVDDDRDAATPDSVDVDGDGFDSCSDCDDAVDSVYPGAAEVVADGVDQDCDGAELCWADADGDGYGDGTVASDDLACDAAGEALVDGDCDDARGDVAPGLPELVCDGVDQDCDPATLDAPDGDADGASVCDDCDDADPARYPGATELVADDVDQDCDGLDRCYVDADGDRVGTDETALSASCADPGVAGVPGDCDDTRGDVAPGAAEVCDGVDNDCDGVVDPGCDTGTVTTSTDETGDTGAPPAEDGGGCRAATPGVRRWGSGGCWSRRSGGAAAADRSGIEVVRSESATRSAPTDHAGHDHDHHHHAGSHWLGTRPGRAPGRGGGGGGGRVRARNAGEKPVRDKLLGH
ncbi:MAG: putative metal-binding motif-containing protein [Myxococcota bacterium]